MSVVQWSLFLCSWSMIMKFTGTYFFSQAKFNSLLPCLVSALKNNLSPLRKEHLDSICVICNMYNGIIKVNNSSSLSLLTYAPTKRPFPPPFHTYSNDSKHFAVALKTVLWVVEYIPFCSIAFHSCSVCFFLLFPGKAKKSWGRLSWGQVLMKERFLLVSKEWKACNCLLIKCYMLETSTDQCEITQNVLRCRNIFVTTYCYCQN